jgi:hypothetical protein
MSNSQDAVEKTIVNAGATIGSTTAGAAAGVAAGAGAANIAAAASAAHLASLAVGPFSGFASILATIGGPTSPAWWALIAVNPVTAPIAGAIGAGLGAVGAFKLCKKLFQ